MTPRPPQQGNAFEVSRITIVGNEQLTTGELLRQMSTRETPGSLSKFLHKNISEILGGEEEFLDLLAFAGDVDRLTQYYQDRGFSEVRIDTSLLFQLEARTVDITITIAEGYRSLVDSLTYVGIVGTPETVWKDIGAESRISQGDPFNLLLLEEEVRRVRRILFDNGYPNATYRRDQSSAKRYASTRNYAVVLVFDPGKRYRFGEITVAQDVDTVNGGTSRLDITDEIIRRHMDYEEGEVYSLAKVTSTEGNLNRLGLFELRAMDLAVPLPTDTSLSVPTHIVLRPLDKHELAPDVFISDEDGAFNVGTGVSYTNRNFLGEARRFATRLRFRTQTIGMFPDYFYKNSLSVSNLDLTFELLQPFVFNSRNKGIWAFSLILDKQKPYLQNIIRNKFGLTARTAEFTTSYLDWVLESVVLSRNETYQIDSTDEQAVRALRLLQNEQFNSILSFTLQRDVTNDRFSPSAGFLHSATLEEAGLFPGLLQRTFGLKTPFTQFYRVILFGRWYTDVAREGGSILAVKLRGGFEDKYGESRGDTTRVIPQTNRFFAGGGNSVRGWSSRGLIALGDPQFGGNMILEGSAELRINLFRQMEDALLNKIWLVLFADAGNVWRTIGDFNVTTVAVAAGMGFRYDTLFGPFRIDWGLRVYDPAAPRGSQWITQQSFFTETIKASVFHFGIGHAF